MSMGTSQKGTDYKGQGDFSFGHGDCEGSVDTSEKLMATGSGVQGGGHSKEECAMLATREPLRFSTSGSRPLWGSI